jgi:hypothetical protein
VVNFFAQVRGKLLGIVQAPMTEFFRENNGGGYNRTSQSTAASLIDPGNTSDANCAEFFLVTKSAAPIHAIRRLHR